MSVVKKILTVAFVLISAFFAHAQDIIEFKCATGDDDPPPIYEKPAKGHRVPQRPIFGYIDFETSTIVFSRDIPGEILSYEIWDDSECLMVTTDANCFVQHLQETCKSLIVVVIRMSESILIGYYTNE